MEQMKRTFKHLQYRDRIKIEMMLREKASIQQIADRLHVTYQTIWRELRRDGVWYEHTLSNLTTERRYSADIAQAQYEKNKRAKGGMIKLGHDMISSSRRLGGNTTPRRQSSWRSSCAG